MRTELGADPVGVQMVKELRAEAQEIQTEIEEIIKAMAHELDGDGKLFRHAPFWSKCRCVRVSLCLTDKAPWYEARVTIPRVESGNFMRELGLRITTPRRGTPVVLGWE